MINLDCTLLKSIEAQIKKASINAEFDSLVLNKILALIILTDIIQWAEKIQPESIEEQKLVQLKDKLLMCYEKYLNVCHSYDEDITKVYTNVNTPQTIYDWQRIWDSVQTTTSGEDERIIRTWGGILDREF